MNAQKFFLKKKNVREALERSSSGNISLKEFVNANEELKSFAVNDNNNNNNNNKEKSIIECLVLLKRLKVSNNSCIIIDTTMNPPAVPLPK